MFLEGDALPPGEMKLYSEGDEIPENVIWLGEKPEWAPAVKTGIDEDKHALLQYVKAQLAGYFEQASNIMFAVARVALKLERERLYEADINQKTGQPYRSMREYWPDLIRELQERSMHKLSKRQVEAYMALERVLVEGLGVTEERILQIGPSVATELLEASDYNPQTGVVSQTPRPGKLGREEALQMIERIEEEGWGLKQAREELGDVRGISRKGVHVEWAKSHDKTTNSSRYSLGQVTLFVDGAVSAQFVGLQTVPRPVTQEQAEWLTKRLGATSNLEELNGF